MRLCRIHVNDRREKLKSSCFSLDISFKSTIYVNFKKEIHTSVRKKSYIYILGIRFTRRLEKTSAWKSINATYIRHDTPNHCSEIEYDCDDYWECMLRHFTRRGDHQMGTCRMGSVNDPSSVVDPKLRLVHYLGQIKKDSKIERYWLSKDSNRFAHEESH